jgi:2'-5' RNA ligase
LAIVAVVAYPLFGEADQRWIDSTRAQHDPQANLIGAHFTLVFPIDADADAVVVHVRSVISEAAPIPLVVKEVRAVPNHSGVGGHVFLVPDGGYPELVALHDRLYEGPLLRDHWLRDIPYVPHMTVATFPAFERCVALAQELDSVRRVVLGSVQSVDVVHVRAETVRTIASFRLEHRVRVQQEAQEC